jgi:predicted flap endonuclease-1-like 5' DNA nuclease
MPYTLMKGLAWVLIAVLLGIVIGWLLRSVSAKRQVERARSANLGTAEREELERLRARVNDLDSVIVERDRLRSELEEVRRASAVVPDRPPDASGDPDEPGGAVDVGGVSVGQDDLTAVVGIDPAIAELCHGIGIRTWAELSATEVSLLRTMLRDAGDRFASHDPSTWPTQAGLLAAGAWDEFAALADEIGRDGHAD